jgi:hypothetical protein
VNPELVNRLQPTPYNRSTIDGGQSAHAAAAVHPRSASPPRNPKQFPESTKWVTSKAGWPKLGSGLRCHRLPHRAVQRGRSFGAQRIRTMSAQDQLANCCVWGASQWLLRVDDVAARISLLRYSQHACDPGSLSERALMGQFWGVPKLELCSGNRVGAFSKLDANDGK